MLIIFLIVVTGLAINHIIGGVFCSRLNKHLQVAHNERYREINSDKPWVPASVDQYRLFRYVLTEQDSDDPVIVHLKKRIRIHDAIFFATFLLIAIIAMLYGLFASE